jgi:hypothetical protein
MIFVVEMLELYQRNITVSIQIADQTKDVYTTVHHEVMAADTMCRMKRKW